MEEQLSFGSTLDKLETGEWKQASCVTWNNKEIKISIQRPDEHSKMTLPYLYMIKGDKQFPITLSNESIFGKWVKVN